MIVRHEKNSSFFSLSSTERRVMERILTAVIANYQVPPGELDEKSAAVWYSTRGFQSARMSAGETADWLKQLHSLRSGRVELLQKLLTEVRAKRPGPFTMAVPIENAETLMIALNDHRLLLAARHDIGEAEMDLWTLPELATLPPGQQVALCEINFLAHIIGELLEILQK